MSDTGPPEDVGTPDDVPEVTMRRPTPPPADDTSPYDGLEDLTAEEPWPLGGGPSEPPRTPSTLPPFLVGLVVGIALAAVSVVAFVVFGSDDEPAATTATTVVPTSTTDTTLAVTTTTVVIPTTEATATAAPSAPLEAVGEPLALEDLSMAASGLGDLRFGDNGDTVLGRLVATFGQPDEDSGTFISTADYGTCDGDVARFVRWGPLAVVVLEPESDPSFAAYRLDLDFGGIESLAAELRTVSGVRAGDTVATLESIYSDTFNISYEVDLEDGLEFQLLDSEGGLLLHGPVTSADPDGVIRGIYSPDSCAS